MSTKLLLSIMTMMFMLMVVACGVAAFIKQEPAWAFGACLCALGAGVSAMSHSELE